MQRSFLLEDHMIDTNRLISIVIPAMNEECSIGYLLDDLAAVNRDMRDYEFEVIVVNDHSQDNTATIALSKKVKVIIVCENNLGQIYPFVKAAAQGNAKVIFLPPKILGTLYNQEEILNTIKEVI